MLGQSGSRVKEEQQISVSRKLSAFFCPYCGNHYAAEARALHELCWWRKEGQDDATISGESHDPVPQETEFGSWRDLLLMSAEMMDLIPQFKDSFSKLVTSQVCPTDQQGISRFIGKNVRTYFDRLQAARVFSRAYDCVSKSTSDRMAEWRRTLLSRLSLTTIANSYAMELVSRVLIEHDCPEDPEEISDFICKHFGHNSELRDQLADLFATASKKLHAIDRLLEWRNILLESIEALEVTQAHRIKIVQTVRILCWPIKRHLFKKFAHIQFTSPAVRQSALSVYNKAQQIYHSERRKNPKCLKSTLNWRNKMVKILRQDNCPDEEVKKNVEDVILLFVHPPKDPNIFRKKFERERSTSEVTALAMKVFSMVAQTRGNKSNKVKSHKVKKGNKIKGRFHGQANRIIADSIKTSASDQTRDNPIDGAAEKKTPIVVGSQSVKKLVNPGKRKSDSADVIVAKRAKTKKRRGAV